VTQLIPIHKDHKMISPFNAYDITTKTLMPFHTRLSTYYQNPCNLSDTFDRKRIVKSHPNGSIYTLEAI
jgi:hypothetical protein